MNPDLDAFWAQCLALGWSDLNPAQWNLAQLKLLQGGFTAWYLQHPLTVTAVYASVFTLLTALCLPGAALLMLLAGACFGLAWGSVVATLASTTGATITMLAARHGLRRPAQSRWAAHLQRLNEGLGREGACYLMSLRLLPLIPFVPLNLLAGLTNLSAWTFFWASALGMLPATALYVHAGVALAQVDSVDALVSGQLLLALLGLGLLPLGTALLLRRSR
jgi:uncharacterized membrane protein YdjX (TVP38/TMEM64 family)